MSVYKTFEKENAGAFQSEVRPFTVLAGRGGAVIRDKGKKYYIVSRTVAAVYDPEAGKLINRTMNMRWPISVREHDAADSMNVFHSRFQEGQLYNITGAFYDNPMGNPFLYVKTAELVEKTGTAIDKSKDEYWTPLEVEDVVLGALTFDRSYGEFQGQVPFGDGSVTIYAIAEWDDKSTWEKPLDVARAFVQDIEASDLNAREYVAQLFCGEDDLKEDIEYFSREIGVEPIDTAEKLADFLQGRLKYIFVEPDGGYSIAYEDGELFGGHEIQVMVDAEGQYYNADIVG